MLICYKVTHNDFIDSTRHSVITSRKLHGSYVTMGKKKQSSKEHERKAKEVAIAGNIIPTAAAFSNTIF